MAPVRRRTLVFMFLLVASTGAADDRSFEGRYIHSAIANTFQPCGSQSVYWVNTSSAVQTRLVKFVRTHTADRQQAVYIEFRGRLLDKPVDGFAADYDGLIEIAELVTTLPQIPAGCK